MISVLTVSSDLLYVLTRSFFPKFVADCEGHRSRFHGGSIPSHDALGQNHVYKLCDQILLIHLSESVYSHLQGIRSLQWSFVLFVQLRYVIYLHSARFVVSTL